MAKLTRGSIIRTATETRHGQTGQRVHQFDNGDRDQPVKSETKLAGWSIILKWRQRPPMAKLTRGSIIRKATETRHGQTGQRVHH